MQGEETRSQRPTGDPGDFCLFLRKPGAMECCKQGSVSQGALQPVGSRGRSRETGGQVAATVLPRLELGQCQGVRSG